VVLKSYRLDKRPESQGGMPPSGDNCSAHRTRTAAVAKKDCLDDR
jgi:hypothetical protein